MQASTYNNLEKQYGANNYKPLDVMLKHSKLVTFIR